MIKGLVKVAALSPEVSIGNVKKNIDTILNYVNTDKRLSNCRLIVTPELSLTGYTCQDMFFNDGLLENVQRGLAEMPKRIDYNYIILSVGAPLRKNNRLYNCSVLMSRSGILAVIPKEYIPNYNEFYEKRWFTPGSSREDNTIMIGNESIPFGNIIVDTEYFKVGAEVCEDLWSVIPPSSTLALAGADIIINNSASNEIVGKAQYRKTLVAQQSARCICGYVYCSAGVTESTSDLMFSGHNIIAENGSVLTEASMTENIVVTDIDIAKIRHDRLVNKTFSDSALAIKDKIDKVETVKTIDYKIYTETLYFKDNEVNRKISITPFVPSNNIDERCKEIFNIQVAGLASRLKRMKGSKLVVGVSGGLDSTLALLVASAASERVYGDASNVVGITMPCFGTTSRTKDNAIALMRELGVQMKEVNIGNSVKQHLKDLGLSEDDRSIAYENAQARERTQLLMDYANMIGGFVVGTGDLSELALGWCTYNGDHMSMYNVNCSIPKTLVRTLVEKIGFMIAKNKDSSELEGCIKDILDTPVSPELLPPSANGEINQLTEDSVGPYVLNDFFLYYTVRFGFKRSQILAYAEEAVKQSSVYNYSKEEIEKWLDKFYTRFTKAQFKRNCCPDGVKVGSVSLNPRGDWRMPSEFDEDALLS